MKAAKVHFLNRPAVPGIQVAIERVILLAEEGSLPAVAALGHVMRIAGHDDPGKACHARSLAGVRQPVNLAHCHRNAVTVMQFNALSP